MNLWRSQEPSMHEAIKMLACIQGDLMRYSTLSVDTQKEWEALPDSVSSWVASAMATSGDFVREGDFEAMVVNAKQCSDAITTLQFLLRQGEPT